VIEGGFEASEQVVERALRQRHNQFRAIGSRVAHNRYVLKRGAELVDWCVTKAFKRDCTKIRINTVQTAELYKGGSRRAQPWKRLGFEIQGKLYYAAPKEIIGLSSVRT